VFGSFGFQAGGLMHGPRRMSRVFLRFSNLAITIFISNDFWSGFASSDISLALGSVSKMKP
jgi:hypothetical protein